MRALNRLSRFALLFSAMVLPLACGAQSESTGPLKFQENVDYAKVRQANDPDTAAGKVQVAEIFWYGCIHCYRFDPTIEEWLEDKPDNIEFIRIPSTLGRPASQAHSKAYYAAEQLGVLDSVHPALFEAIHKDGKTMTSEAEIAKLFEDAGIERDQFSKVFNSFGVNSRVQRAEALIRQYGLTSVPSVVVDGKYITSSRYAGSNDKILEVAEFLASVRP